MNEREKDLLSLINFEKSLKEISENLSQYSWDYDGHPTILSRDTLKKF